MARQMKDSGIEWIGEIPESWNTIRFKYLHNGMNTGEAIDKENWTSDENDKIFYTAGLVPIRTNYADFPDWKFTTEDDLLLARNGTPYVYYPHTGACYTDHIIRAMLKQGYCKRFIQYSLQQSIASVVVETVSIATWSASLWNEQVIAWPSVSEQHHIADFLDRKCAEIDAVIERTKATIEEYKKLKQAVITEAVTKGVRGPRSMKDSGIEYLGEYPCEWSISTISTLFTFLGGFAFKSELFCEETNNQVVRIGNIRDGTLLIDNKAVYIDDEYAEATNESMVKADDILFSMTGTKGKKDYFYTVLVMPQHLAHKRLFLNQRVGCFRSKQNLNMKYYSYLLKVNRIREYIFLFETGTANQGNLGIETIKRTKLFRPSYSEQKEIAVYLDEKCAALDTLIAKKTALLTELETYKKSLIYEYVTGKKEVD